MSAEDYDDGKANGRTGCCPPPVSGCCGISTTRHCGIVGDVSIIGYHSGLGKAQPPSDYDVSVRSEGLWGVRWVSSTP